MPVNTDICDLKLMRECIKDDVFFRNVGVGGGLGEMGTKWSDGSRLLNHGETKWKVFTLLYRHCCYLYYCCIKRSWME